MKGNLVLKEGSKIVGELIGVISKEISGDIVVADDERMVVNPEYEDKLVVYSGKLKKKYYQPSEIAIRGIILGNSLENLEDWKSYLRNMGINGFISLEVDNLVSKLQQKRVSGRIELVNEG